VQAGWWEAASFWTVSVKRFTPTPFLPMCFLPAMSRPFDLNCVHFARLFDGDVAIMYGSHVSKLRTVHVVRDDLDTAGVGVVEIASLYPGPVMVPVQEIMERIGAADALLLIDDLVYAWPGAVFKNMLEFYAPRGKRGLRVLHGNGNAASSSGAASVISFLLENKFVWYPLAGAVTVGTLALLKVSTEKLLGFNLGTLPIFSPFSPSKK